jgi:hypothetical protein
MSQSIAEYFRAAAWGLPSAMRCSTPRAAPGAAPPRCTATPMGGGSGEFRPAPR